MTAKPTLVIDFDETLTAMPEFWLPTIQLAKSLGHRVLVMTQRRCTIENIDMVDEWLSEKGFEDIAVHFCDCRSKLWKLKDLDIAHFVLCDNDPKAAVEGV